MTDYHYTKFGLIWSKESKVTEGGGIRLPQDENVLNRLGEIGLSIITISKSENHTKLSVPSYHEPPGG